MTQFVDKETETEQVMELGLEPRTPSFQFFILPKPVATCGFSSPSLSQPKTAAQPSVPTLLLSRFFGLVIIMDGMLPVPFLHAQPLTQPRTRQNQVGSEGPRNTVPRTVIPPQCTLGSGDCVSRSDHSRLATFDISAFPSLSVLVSQKRTQIWAWESLGSEHQHTWLHVLALSLSCHVTALRL